MDNPFDEITRALDQARSVQRVCDRASGDLARILRGQLKFVPDYILKDLKRELRDFNIHTG